jgi:hypothetical protein
MYKFTPEQKKATKELIRKLHDKYYLNSGSKPDSPGEPKPKDSKKTSAIRSFYSDVKAWLTKQNWSKEPPRALAIEYYRQNPDLPIQKITQYAQRIIWELKRKGATSRP